MRRDLGRLILGGALVLIGLLFLLQNFNVFFVGFGSMWDVIWGVAFLAGGAAFVSMYIRDRRAWWPLVPGMALIGIGLTILINMAVSGRVAEATGGLFLGLIGVAFLIVYFSSRENWWALIPAGVLITLGVVAGISPYYSGEATGAIFFFGLAITFALLYALPARGGQKPWAIWPAVVLAGLGVVVLLSAGLTGIWAGSLILIVIGLALLYRFFRPVRS